MEVFDSSTKPSYFFNGPFRFVKAYEHCFKTHAKGRWVGNPILDTLEKEFKAYSREYYDSIDKMIICIDLPAHLLLLLIIKQNAIEKGKILVNKQKQNINYRFKNNDLFEHYTLRVEPPVLNVLPKVIFEDDKVFVISKPPYISVHATGGFHFNSLVGLLKFQMGYNSELHVLHRIDKLTSGVLIMAKDRDITKKFHESDEIQKFYLARVHGNFPHDNLVYEKPIYCISKKEGTYAVLDSTDEEEIKTKGAKQSKTVFKKLWYDEVSDSTLLECQPITGRTHQIRVHVSSLGFPIINDTLYGGKFLGNGLIMVKFPHLFTNVSTESDKVIGETTESEIIQQEIKNEKISKQKAESNKDDQEEQKVESNANGDEDKLETIEKKQKNNEGEAATTVVKVLQGNEKDSQTEQKSKLEKEESSSALMQNHLKEVGEDGAYKLTEENGIYKLEGNYIENHEWDYKTQPMEICLHSVKYIFQSYIFEDEKPYWADQKFNFKI